MGVITICKHLPSSALFLFEQGRILLMTLTYNLLFSENLIPRWGIRLASWDDDRSTKFGQCDYNYGLVSSVFVRKVFVRVYLAGQCMSLPLWSVTVIVAVVVVICYSWHGIVANIPSAVWGEGVTLRNWWGVDSNERIRWISFHALGFAHWMRNATM